MIGIIALKTIHLDTELIIELQRNYIIKKFKVRRIKYKILIQLS